MSHSTLNKPLSRRSMLAGTAATATAAATALTFGLPGSAAAKVATVAPLEMGAANNALCIAHHKELSKHLSTILNASYVEERMKNKVLSTTHCPHCKVAIAPEMKSRAAFAALA